jgi:hypothetical protein
MANNEINKTFAHLTLPNIAESIESGGSSEFVIAPGQEQAVAWVIISSIIKNNM